MAERKGQDERGLSARQLIFVFLAGVAVCGVFFSLGFLVGYNERASKTLPPAESVTGSSAVIPPPVNPPVESRSAVGSKPATGTTAPAPTPAAGGREQLPTESVQAEKPLTAPPVQAAGTKPTTPAVTPPQPAVSKPVAPLPAAAPPGGEVGTGFTVQVAASRTKADAESLVKILKSKGYPVFLVTPEYARADDNLFRVQVGPFTSREDADKVRAKLAQEGFKPFIKH
jgi:cell division septation protein DedD